MVLVNKPEPQHASLARILSLEREKEIVEAFTFLASTTDDPKKVLALCIKETKNGDGMIINIAANNGDLMGVKEGLLRISTLLQQVSRRGR